MRSRHTSAPYSSSSASPSCLRTRSGRPLRRRRCSAASWRCTSSELFPEAAAAAAESAEGVLEGFFALFLFGLGGFLALLFEFFAALAEFGHLFFDFLAFRLRCGFDRFLGSLVSGREFSREVLIDGQGAERVHGRLAFSGQLLGFGRLGNELFGFFVTG